MAYNKFASISVYDPRVWTRSHRWICLDELNLL